MHRAVVSRGTISPTAVKRVGDTTEYVDTTGAPSLEAAIQSYRADPRVRYAEPDYVVHALDLPNDQYFGNQYGMEKIQAPAAWSTTHGSGNVKIAILDCGIYEAHPDLVGKVVAHQDFTGSEYGADDRCNHGTHVAGIASAATNNATGVAGLGYDTKLLNGKILSDGGTGYDTQVADGIRWAADNGANSAPARPYSGMACRVPHSASRSPRSQPPSHPTISAWPGRRQSRWRMPTA